VSATGSGKPWRLWVVTLGGAGLLPIMPGTWGSAVAAGLAWEAYRAGWPLTEMLIAGLILFSVLCVWLGDWAQAFLGRKDPGPVVLDEAAGICLTLLAQPMRHGAWVILAAFVAFRIFDVTKPPPARQLEKLPGGWGILLDDLAAAAYANLACQIIFRFIVP
jgi:phosphatidylglycerophosphatase A